jgi:hypothetical protein
MNVPGYLGRKRVPAQGIAYRPRRGPEVGGEQGVGAEGAGGNLVGQAPHGALEGGAAG